MKKYLISILSFFIFVSTSVVASAADKVTLQLQWFTQAQFAGYYVALDNGYYSDEGLDVTIKPGGVDISPPQVMAAGGADVRVYRAGVVFLCVLELDQICNSKQNCRKYK